MDFVVNMVRGCSKHSGAKHGSVIVGPDGGFRSLGYNGLPRTEDDGDLANTVHPRKRELTMCAERNALMNLELIGGVTKGCTLYADAVPCAQCAAAIVKSGIKHVVMVDAQHRSRSLDHNFWTDGISLLLENGIGLRRLDSGLPRYGEAATEKHYHPPIPSNSVDWDARFLAFAQYAERWSPAGTGEVLAHRPAGASSRYDKIIRGVGCWSAASPVHSDVLDAVQGAGVSAKGCTLYLSRAEPLGDIDRIVGSGVIGVVLPDDCADSAILSHARPALEAAGLRIALHQPDLQDFRRLVCAVPANVLHGRNDHQSMTLKPQPR